MTLIFDVEIQGQTRRTLLHSIQHLWLDINLWLVPVSTKPMSGNSKLLEFQGHMSESQCWHIWFWIDWHCIKELWNWTKIIRLSYCRWNERHVLEVAVVTQIYSQVTLGRNVFDWELKNWFQDFDHYRHLSIKMKENRSWHVNDIEKLFNKIEIFFQIWNLCDQEASFSDM